MLPIKEPVSNLIELSSTLMCSGRLLAGIVSCKKLLHFHIAVAWNLKTTRKSSKTPSVFEDPSALKLHYTVPKQRPPGGRSFVDHSRPQAPENADTVGQTVHMGSVWLWSSYPNLSV